MKFRYMPALRGGKLVAIPLRKKGRTWVNPFAFPGMEASEGESYACERVALQAGVTTLLNKENPWNGLKLPTR